MKRKALLLVDLSYQTYRACAVHHALESNDGAFTGGLYGFLTTLAKQIRETEASRVIVCDDVKPYQRSIEYPAYKTLRKDKADPELRELVECSRHQIRSALLLLGIPVARVKGFESDDCIAFISYRSRHRFERIYASSNDSDLYQLLHQPNLLILKDEVKDAVDGRKLLETTGLSPDEFMLASALQGTHNDIEGIPNVGPTRAAAAIKDPAIMRKYRERWAEVIDRNLRLIKLPHPAFPGVPQGLITSGEFDHRALYRFCGGFDIQVTKAMLDSFTQIHQP